MCCTGPCRDEGEDDAAAVFVGGGIVSYPSRQSSHATTGFSRTTAISPFAFTV
jgi:hypothetical protein